MYKLVVKDFENLKRRCNDSTTDKFSPRNYYILREHTDEISLNDRRFEGLKFVRFITTLRTDLSNEVIVDSDNKFYGITEVEALSNGLDLDNYVLLNAKNYLESIMESNVVNIVLNTTVIPLGVRIYNDEVYVYSVIVIKKEATESEYFNLVEGCSLKKIEELNVEGLEHNLKDRLIIVGGKNNERDNSIQ